MAGAAAILYLIDDSISVNGEFNINIYKIVINNFDLVKMEWGNGPPNPSASSGPVLSQIG